MLFLGYIWRRISDGQNPGGSPVIYLMGRGVFQKAFQKRRQEKYLPVFRSDLFFYVCLVKFSIVRLVQDSITLSSSLKKTSLALLDDPMAIPKARQPRSIIAGLRRAAL